MNINASMRGDLVYRLNAVGLFGVALILAISLFDQVAFYDLPCPLCLLQRVAFVIIGVGLVLNLCVGSSRVHYGMVIVGALAGLLASGRQILLHIVPGTGAYGSALFGLHFYTLAFVAFIVTLLCTGIVLMLEAGTSIRDAPRESSRIRWIGRTVVWFFAAIVGINVLSTLLECGLGQCEDDPVSYMLLDAIRDM